LEHKVQAEKQDSSAPVGHHAARYIARYDSVQVDSELALIVAQFEPEPQKFAEHLVLQEPKVQHEVSELQVLEWLAELLWLVLQVHFASILLRSTTLEMV